jgi:hypothetical protein
MLSDPLFNSDQNAGDDNTPLSGDDDSPLNTRHRVPPPPTDIYSTLFRQSGQPINDNIPVKDILHHYKATDVQITFPVEKYKKARLDVNGNNINKSFDRFDKYRRARTT